MARPVPRSLWWAGLLVAASLAAAVASGGVLFMQTREANRAQANAATLGNAEAGERAFARYGCGACHVIPGISGAQGQVGPDLATFGQRTLIAGSFENDPATLTRWLMHPQAMRPGSGMPEMGVTQRDARNMAAYLYAQ